MKKFLFAVLIACFGAGLIWSAKAQDAGKPAGAKRSAAPATKRSAPAREPQAPKPAAEEQAIGAAAEALVKAYDARDAQALAASFTANGEYVDEQGAVFHGRTAIADEFAGFFKANPDTSIEIRLAGARSIAEGVVAADGITQFARARGEPAIAGRCHLVCTKEGGKWLLAGFQEIAAANEQASHHDHVQQLEWLVGEWIDEGSDSHVHFSCRWDESGNFLLRDFAVHIAGQKTITGTQRIGYDPVTGHLKTWVFDSAGGYADGYFHREGERWMLHTSGVTADGRMASGTNIFTPLDKHRVSWEAVDRVVGGERIADIQKVTIVRKPPMPADKAK